MTTTMTQLGVSTRSSLRAFSRDTASTIFAVVFPVFIFVAMGFAFGSGQITDTADARDYFLPGMIVLGIVSATFFNLAMGLTVRREKGQLKRLRSTPMNPLVYIGGYMVASTIIAAVVTALLLIVGALVFDLGVASGTWPIFLVTVVVGSLVFGALGIAITAVIPSIGAASGVTNLVAFTLYFISDVFYPISPDSFLAKVGLVFPMRHLALALQQCTVPGDLSTSPPWSHWAVMAIWGVGATLVAARWFDWFPRMAGGAKRR